MTVLLCIYEKGTIFKFINGTSVTAASMVEEAKAVVWEEAKERALCLPSKQFWQTLRWLRGKQRFAQTECSKGGKQLTLTGYTAQKHFEEPNPAGPTLLHEWRCGSYDAASLVDTAAVWHVRKMEGSQVRYAWLQWAFRGSQRGKNRHLRQRKITQPLSSKHVISNKYVSTITTVWICCMFY